jgi:hypothetical protein
MESILKSDTCNNPNSIFRVLDDLTAGVDEMHRITLKRIDDQPESDVDTAHRVFLWLLYARQLRLSTSEAELDIACEFPTADDILYEVAVSQREGPVEKDDVSPLPLVLSICRGFVVLEEARSESGIPYRKLRFVRTFSIELSEPRTTYSMLSDQSTQKYIRELKLGGLSNPHTKLAMSCAIHLKSHFERLRALHGTEGIKDIDLVQYRRSHPFLAYAEYNLAYHAGMSKREETLHPFVQTVLSQQASNAFYPFSPHRFNTTLNQSLHGG